MKQRTDIEHFFKVLRCPVILREQRSHGDNLPKITVHVPRKHFNIVRWYLNKHVRLGVLVDVQTKTFLFKKYEFNWTEM